MTWNYATPVIWTCNRCSTNAPGTVGVLPEGWTARQEWHKAADTMPTRYECHYCPECSTRPMAKP